jgi:uncharacterized membrane protein YphA (DoxX/SURF4 family)
MNTRIQAFGKLLDEKYAKIWTTLRALAGIALVCHGVFLFSHPLAAGNWLEVRTSEPLRLAISLGFIAAGTALAIGFFTRIAALLAAPFYYWAAMTDIISAGNPPLHQTALNAIAFLVLMAFAIFGAQRHTAAEWWKQWHAGHSTTPTTQSA